MKKVVCKVGQTCSFGCLQVAQGECPSAAEDNHSLSKGGNAEVYLQKGAPSIPSPGLAAPLPPLSNR